MNKNKQMQRSGITAAGTWIVDYSKEILHFPEEGSCVPIFSETTSNGGAPYNLLVNLCRLGFPHPLRAVGCLGKDLDGASIIKDCESHGIDASRMKSIPWASTSFSDVMVSRDTGVRTSFNHAGANDLLTAEDFQMQSDNSRILFFGSLFFLSALDAPDKKYGTVAAAVLARTREQGILTCVDIERTRVLSGVFRDAGRAALKQTDLVILNVEVAEELSGVRMCYPIGVDLAAAENAALALQELSAAKCVVLRFPAGALAVSDCGKRIAQGSVKLPKAKIAGAAGAGHAFTAGFLYGYHEQWGLEDCLRAAHASAAACLGNKTASGGVRILSSCLRNLEKLGQRELDFSASPG